MGIGFNVEHASGVFLFICLLVCVYIYLFVCLFAPNSPDSTNPMQRGNVGEGKTLKDAGQALLQDQSWEPVLLLYSSAFNLQPLLCPKNHLDYIFLRLQKPVLL